MGDLAPKTATEFRAAGVVFRASGGRYACAGPKGRPDLIEALRAAIGWRVEAMRARVRARPVAAVVLALSRPPAVGACRCCGEPLPPYRGGDCELCVMAFERALDAERAPP